MFFGEVLNSKECVITVLSENDPTFLTSEYSSKFRLQDVLIEYLHSLGSRYEGEGTGK